MMPPGIGQLLKMMGQRQQAGSGSPNPHRARPGDFPVTLPEYARMGDTSNEAIRRFQAERDGTPQEAPPAGDRAEQDYTSDSRGYYPMGRPEWAPPPQTRDHIGPRGTPGAMPRDATNIPPPRPQIGASVEQYNIRHPTPTGDWPSSALNTERTGGYAAPDMGDRGSVEGRKGSRISQMINDALTRMKQEGGPMGVGVSAMDAVSGDHPGDMLAGPGFGAIGRGAGKVAKAIKGKLPNLGGMSPGATASGAGRTAGRAMDPEEIKRLWRSVYGDRPMPSHLGQSMKPPGAPMEGVPPFKGGPGVNDPEFMEILRRNAPGPHAIPGQSAKSSGGVGADDYLSILRDMER